MELKPISYYVELKHKLGKYNEVYKTHVAPKPFVGDNSYLYSILKPESYQDFFDKYTTYLDPYDKSDREKKNIKYGRSIDYLKKLAKKYKELANDNEFSEEQFFDDIICHVIIETFDGHKPEKELKRILGEYGFEVEETSGVMDSEYGVDLIVRKDGVVKEYIQVKPLSTFLGDKNVSLMNDRGNFYLKQYFLDQFVEDHPDFVKRNIIFMLYDYNYLVKTGEVLWCYRGDKVKFKLNELTETNGKPLVKFNEFVSKKLILK